MTTSTATPLAPHQAAARIHWTGGKVIGFSVPVADHLAADVVQLRLDGRQLASVVANCSVFDMAQELAGLPLPSREFCAFELRIPEGSLMPGDLTRDTLRLSLHSAGSERPFFEQTLRGLHELLHLTDGAPLDWLFSVDFRGLRHGAVQGVVRDRHGCGIRPQLWSRLNDGPLDAVSFHEASADGRVLHFQIPLRADRLIDGDNRLTLQSADAQILAAFPIQIGPVAGSDDAQRRIEALEAQMAFVKQLLLTLEREGLSARLAQLKGDVVGIVSEMMSLQRTSLEREVMAAVQMQAAAPPTPDTPPAA